ncbi:MAG: glycosyltransferase [Actinobacteria bacterium]|nr:glycosyltransferase [Actinomycetota bacterium]
MGKQKVYIVTLLAPRGETGVQTHFNAFADIAWLNQVEVDIITPGKANMVMRGTLRRIGILLGWCKKEWGILWTRWVQYVLLLQLLYLRLRCHKTYKKTIYAQDPLSAKAALRLRNAGHALEIVLVLHFNISEAHEVIEKGYATKGSLLYRHFLKLEKEVLPRVDRLLFVSDFMRQQVQSRLPETMNIPTHVIPNFASIPNSQEADELHSESRDLISVGTLEPRKNQEFLLHVLVHAHRLGYRYQLTLVGDGPSRKRLEDLASELGLTQYVLFMGFQQNGASLIVHHRAYAHAARMESFGLVITEALASGKPVFAAPVGGIPEIFNDGVEGVFWDLDNPQRSAELLIEVLEDQDTYRNMCLAAKERYMKNFSPEVLGRKWLNAVVGSSDTELMEQTLAQTREYCS